MNTTATPERTAGGSIVIDTNILGILIFVAVLMFVIFFCCNEQRERSEERQWPFVWRRPRTAEMESVQLGRSSG